VGSIIIFFCVDSHNVSARLQGKYFVKAEGRLPL